MSFGQLSFHATRFVRMFMATSAPSTLAAGLPFFGVRPTIAAKSPSGFRCTSSAGVSFQAATPSFEQMYMKPVFGLNDDGGQSAPPSGFGAKIVNCLSLTVVYRQPIL